ncbi:MAG: hypothetical protein JXR52_12550 [Bacteroidales bacterium]|nr:hypothetical protein [Bacteroidales bacterium]MBN2699648.1 hypothetical protein [Bacteroidales bacterium]
MKKRFSCACRLTMVNPKKHSSKGIKFLFIILYRFKITVTFKKVKAEINFKANNLAETINTSEV